MKSIILIGKFNKSIHRLLFFRVNRKIGGALLKEFTSVYPYEKLNEKFGHKIFLKKAAPTFSETLFSTIPRKSNSSFAICMQLILHPQL